MDISDVLSRFTLDMSLSRQTAGDSGVCQPKILDVTSV